MEKMAHRGQWIKLFSLLILAVLFFGACKEEKTSIPPAKLVVPIFNADSAYHFIEKQLSFGPRVPGTQAQIECKDWLVNKLKSYGAKTIVQEYTATIYDGTELPGYNIMAQFNPKATQRVLLSAHWDTRKVADKDDERKEEPIMGADDGASGVAALIEIARLIEKEPLNLGVDILLFDLEDQGDLDGSDSSTDTYALGSRYWSENVVPSGYKAKFGILLDMIGAKGASFGQEAYSKQYAGQYVDKIWSLAKKMGKGNLFRDYNAGAIGDDHINVMKAGIPMVDIINRPMVTASGFGTYHHTHDDDIDNIDKSVLKAVGQVVTAVVYREAVGRF